MKISDNERLVYLALHMCADRPVSKIASDCGLREHAVRYAIQSMSERCLFQTELVVDEVLVGLQHYRMFFNLSPGRTSLLAEIEQAFLSDPIVSFLGRVSGEYRYCVAFYVSDFSQIEIFLDRLKELFGIVIGRKLIARLFGWTYFGKKYLDARWKPNSSLRTGHTQGAVILDELDRKTVSLLSKYPLASTADLSKRMGLPASTVTFRLQRLRRLGIVGAPLHRMNLSVAGVHAFFALVQSRFPSKKFSEKLLAYASAHPNIVEVCHGLGGWDHELFIEAEEPSVMHRVANDLEILFPEHIESITPLVRLDDIKWIPDFQPILV